MARKEERGRAGRPDCSAFVLNEILMVGSEGKGGERGQRGREGRKGEGNEGVRWLGSRGR